MCEALMPIENFQQKLSLEGRDNCNICYENPGFPTLCNIGDPGEHRFCMECIVKQYKQESYSNKFSCSVCRSRFNLRDYLIVGELYLLQSNVSTFILGYFHEMQSDVRRYSSEQSLEDFLSSDEKDQKRVISILYWGNNCLFDGVNNYPKDTKNKRIKDNLVEMFGNLWSPRLDAKEKNKQLSQIFKNGRSIRYCQNESQETFLHRCHLFLRAFLPLYVDPSKNVGQQMKNIKKFVPRYLTLWAIPYLYSPITCRPATGPLGIELVGLKTDPSTSTFLDWQHQYKNYLNLYDCK